MARPALRTPPHSRDRLLEAAAAEFADRGYAGAGVDRIARRARLNKAMIYYHFPNKQALYRAVLQETFRAVGARVRTIADGPLPPDRKIREFVNAISAEASRRPHFPPIMLRELAEGGRHLDTATLTMMGGLLQTVTAILANGRETGVFRDVPVFVAYLSMVTPVVIFHATAALRDAVKRATGLAAPVIETGTFVDSLQEFLLRSLAAEPRKLVSTKPREAGASVRSGEDS
jgi:TetR/AcrR family transcriptional regulator